MIGRTGQADRTDITGQAEQDWQIKTARKGLSGKEGTARIRLPRQGCLDQVARAGLLEEDSQARTERRV